MPNVINNPFFQVGILFVVATGAWFFATDETVDLKKKILNLVTDGLYYFVLTTFGLNLLINFKDIIRQLYQIVLFSSEVSWLALMSVTSYLFFKNRKKLSRHNHAIDLLINYFLLLALFNHLFYYYKYQNINSVIFMIAYFIFYLFKDRIQSPWKNELTLIALTILHGLMMTFFGKVVIYYQIVFYPYQVVSLLVFASLLLYYFRRNLLSKQK